MVTAVMNCSGRARRPARCRCTQATQFGDSDIVRHADHLNLVETVDHLGAGIERKDMSTVSSAFRVTATMRAAMVSGTQARS
jgi:hypothetical protein